jgi:hypothetical protein
MVGRVRVPDSARHDPHVLDRWPSGGSDRRRLQQIAYVHLGGGEYRDGLYYDTRAHPVVPGVLRLVEELYARIDAPGVLLEHRRISSRSVGCRSTPRLISAQ